MRILRTSVGILAVLVAGAACGPRGAEDGGPAAPTTLVWGISAQPDCLNPLVASSAQARQLNDLLFLRLNDFGSPPALAYEPRLARSWELSADGRTLTYALREDAVWEDGVPVTARDVTFTVEMMSHPEVPYAYKNIVERIEACDAPDEFTVRFRFTDPPPAEPLYETQFHIVPEHVLAAVPPAEMVAAAFNRAPLGNGRWRVVEWVSEDRLVLAANDRCVLGRPIYDRLVFRFIPEANTLRAELLTGGVDVYHRFPSRFYGEDADREELVFVRFPDRTYTYIGWNHRNPLFADVRVRRALTLATDRWTIIEAFREGLGQVMATPVYPQHRAFAADVQPLPFDPAEAARLLDAAGWAERDADGVRVRDGRRFAFTFLLTSGNAISEEIATMAQAEFRKLGIAVTTEFLEWTVFLERLGAKAFDAAILSRRLGFVYDVENLFHSRSIEGKYNDVSFSHPEVDSLIDLAKTVRDREERAAVWQEFQRVFHREMGVTVLYAGQATYAVRRERVANPVMDIRGGLVRVHEWRPAGSP